MASPDRVRRRRRSWVVGAAAAILVVVLLVVALVPSLRNLFPPLGPGTPGNPSSFPVSHFVFLIMENHAFDNYFGAYCAVAGPYCTSAVNGIPPGTCVPENPLNGTTPCTAPFVLPQSQVVRPDDMPHSWQPSHVAWDGGAMDGFLKAERDANTLGYYNASELPVYWDLAETFGLGDDFFSSTLSYSLPNHWYLLAGQAPEESQVSGFPASPSGGLTPEQQLYLNEANMTRAISDILVNSSLSWKYYDYALQRSYDVALGEAGSGGGGTAPKGPFNYWNPLAAKAESYGADYTRHFVNVDDFFNDSRAGTLPNAAWVIPPFNDSDHPPADLRSGESFVAGVVDALESSPEWNSTALFVTWDDYGGYYDHVAPPQLDRFGLSFRTPLLVVSPYTPAGYVGHHFAYFESFLKMLEWRFGLPSLTSRDAGAPLLLDYFEPGARRPTVEFPTNASAAAYPIPLPGPAAAFGDTPPVPADPTIAEAAMGGTLATRSSGGLAAALLPVVLPCAGASAPGSVGARGGYSPGPSPAVPPDVRAVPDCASALVPGGLHIESPGVLALAGGLRPDTAAEPSAPRADRYGRNHIVPGAPAEAPRASNRGRGHAKLGGRRRWPTTCTRRSSSSITGRPGTSGPSRRRSSPERRAIRTAGTISSSS